MSEAVQERENGYRAFISYSHRDDAAAKSLHKRLETYRLPKKLIGQAGERGPIPERLTPIFRDLDELSAADDLTVEIKAALARSATLIVLCSPGAKASKWVNLEIETFRALHGNTRPVLAALIEGEPADAFPPALIADGQEPVAADFRKNRDGKSLALLKLVAGMAGAPLDALVQRDAQRQYRRVMAITGTALTAALAMALLLVVALRAQSDAERQRQEAEGLVEYMLTDLRDKLKGVGRLDVMTAVNERAMKYYGGDTVKAQLLKARTLHALGEDDGNRGDTDLAFRKFQEAHRTTIAILEQKREDPDRVFVHAQSEFWLGDTAYRLQNFDQGRQHFTAYMKLTDLAYRLKPNSKTYLTETGFARTNFCILALTTKPPAIDEANRYCASALHIKRKLVRLYPNDNKAKGDLINGLAWQAEALMRSGDIKNSRRLLEEQFYLASNQVSNNPLVANYIEQLARSRFALAQNLYRSKLIESDKIFARKLLLDASNDIINLIERDSNNQNYKNLRDLIVNKLKDFNQ